MNSTRSSSSTVLMVLDRARARRDTTNAYLRVIFLAATSFRVCERITATSSALIRSSAIFSKFGYFIYLHAFYNFKPSLYFGCFAVFAGRAVQGKDDIRG